MAEYIFGVTKANGQAGNDEAVTLQMDFWNVTTTVNVLVNGDAAGGTSASQAALNKLIEIVSERGQPVILNNPTVASGTYTVKFAIEHRYSWGTDGTALVAAIAADGINYGFGAATNTATLSTSLI